MTFAQIFSVLLIPMLLGTLLFTRISPATAFPAAMTLLMLTGILRPGEALSGFSNPGVVAIAALFVIAMGLQKTGAIEMVVRTIFGRGQRQWIGQLRLMAPVTVLSAFINNTPLVAAFLPAVTDWARKQSLSPSPYLLPLSYAAILGGTCTLIGTSTNLVVNGLLIQSTGQGMQFFELARVGIPCAVIGTLYVLLASPRLLKERKAALEILNNPREYTVEMIVEPNSPLVGRTVERAGLRNLPGLYLVEIDRHGDILPAVSPDTELRADDRLVFAGIPESVADLQKIQGLKPATNQVFKLDTLRHARCLIEAVLSPQSTAVGKTVKQGRFRNRYDAVVIAVARDGQRIRGKIGDIELRAGDTLLLETDPGFEARNRHLRDFLLLKSLEEGFVVRHNKAWLAWLILGCMVAADVTGIMDIATAALTAAGLMVALRCCTGPEARASIDLEVLIVIGSAFSLGTALDKTGAASSIAGTFIGAAGSHPEAVLASVYIATVMMTEVITNNAAALLMFPLAQAAAHALGFNLMPFAMAITFAASASFATPIGYQTNLMVYGPGGYRFSDYLRFGLPLNILVGMTALMIIPHVWPLVPIR